MRKWGRGARNVKHELRTIRRMLVVLGSWCLALGLSGCFLIAGEQSSGDTTTDGGNVYSTFVSADGTEVRSVPTDFRDQQLLVTVSARNQQGLLRIDVLNSDNSVVFTVDAQPSDQTKRGVVATNAAGEFRYRLTTSGAQQGEFQILFQPSG